MESLWQKTLELLNKSLKAEDLNRWIAPLVPLDDKDDSVLTLSVPNKFFIDWISENYTRSISEAAASAAGRPLSVNLVVSAHEPEQKPRPPQSQFRPGPEKEPAPAFPFNHGLNEKYLFENFVVGDSNRFAHAAAFGVSNLPGQTYNPLFIYSAAGLGKTHLINAVGNHIQASRPTARVAYVSCENFTNQMIKAIADKSMDAFRKTYRNTDVLLIDDVQFLGGKESTQEEFFYTFNTLYDQSRQIVLTSDKKPKDISGLEDRLRSRFEWGLIADIQTPDSETKAAIITKKAQEEGLVLPEEVAYRLASTEDSNIRVLEGYLVRVAAYSSMTGQPISLNLTNHVLQDAFYRNEITVEDIIKTVVLRFGISLTDMKSAKKNKTIAEPRQIAMYLARKMTKESLIRIGDKFGGKDHSTVVHAVKKIKSRMEEDFRFRRDMDQLERNIRSSS